MRSKLIDLFVLVIITLFVLSWWVVSESRTENKSLEEVELFLYEQPGMLQWLEIISKNGRISGEWHQWSLSQIKEETTLIDKQMYPIKGEQLHDWSKLNIEHSEQPFTVEIRVAKTNLFVRGHEDADPLLFKAVNQDTLNQLLASFEKE